MSDEFQIRPVLPADFPQWKPLWDGYNAFYGRKDATALPDAVTAMTWSRFFDPYEPMHALVAEQSGQLLGLVHFIFHRTTISIAPTCYLQDLFTLESARGKGVGRALIHAVYERARQAGSARVYWLTHESNATAIALYAGLALFFFWGRCGDASEGFAVDNEAGLFGDLVAVLNNRWRRSYPDHNLSKCRRRRHCKSKQNCQCKFLHQFQSSVS